MNNLEINYYYYYYFNWRSPCSIVANVQDHDIVVNEFKFQSRYYVHFRINTLGKGMKPLILPPMG